MSSSIIIFLSLVVVWVVTHFLSGCLSQLFCCTSSCCWDRWEDSHSWTARLDSAFSKVCSYSYFLREVLNSQALVYSSLQCYAIVGCAVSQCICSTCHIVMFLTMQHGCRATVQQCPSQGLRELDLCGCFWYTSYFHYRSYCQARLHFSWFLVRLVPLMRPHVLGVGLTRMIMVLGNLVLIMLHWLWSSLSRPFVGLEFSLKLLRYMTLFSCSNFFSGHQSFENKQLHNPNIDWNPLILDVVSSSIRT